jgi:hypothetical protein
VTATDERLSGGNHLKGCAVRYESLAHGIQVNSKM